MADRTVKVKLKADVSDYVKDVALATAATRALRAEAERFEDRYTATLRVNTVGAVRDMKAAEQGVSRSASNMSKALDNAGRKLESRLKLFRGQLADLGKFGTDDLLNIDARKILSEIAQVRARLASLNGQRVTFQVAGDIANARADLARLVGDLRRLDRSQYEARVKLQTDSLRADIKQVQRDLVDSGPGSFADRLRKQVEGAYRSLPALDITADSDQASREIAKIRAELAALGDKRIGVDIDEKSFMAQAAALQARLRAIAATSTSTRFQVDAAGAAAQLDDLGGAAQDAGRKIDGADRANDRFHKGLLHTVRNAADTAHALRTLTIPPALFAAVPAVSSLGASLTQVGSAAAMLPGLLMGAGVGLSAILVGFKDWADVVEQLGKGKLDKAATQAQELSREAQATAMKLIELAKAYDAAAEATQDELFRGTAGELQQLADGYLPLIRTHLAAVAREINIAAVAFSDFATRADTIRDAEDGLRVVREATVPLAGTIVNLSTIMRDMGAVGARELPSLAANFEAMTTRWVGSISRARANGDLARWIAEGRAEVNQLGRVFGNTGSIMLDFFRAGEAAGIDTLGTLERLTARARDYMNSWQGQAEVRTFLSEMRDDAATFLPGLQALAGAALDFVQHLSGSGTLAAAGDAFSALAESARPVIAVISELTSMVLRPLLGVIQGIAPVLGPAIAGMIAFRTASSAITTVQRGLIGGVTATGAATTGLAGRFDRAAQAASGNANATSKVSTALGRVSGALPYIGLALLAVAGGYEALRDRSDDAASSLLSSSASFQEAVNQQVSALERQQAVMSIDPGYAQGQILAADATDQHSVAIKNEADARAQVLAAAEAQIAKMAPLEAANARVTLNQQLLNDAVDRYKLGSPEAINASVRLTDAQKQLEIQQLASRLGVDQHTAALQRQRDVMLGAIDAEIQWKASIDQANQSIAQNGVNLDLNTQQGRANQQALNDMARAAQADAEAKREQNVAIDEQVARGRAHQDQLYRTALQMGMTKEEAYNYVAQLALVPPDRETRFFTPGLREALDGATELTRLLGALTGTATAKETLSGAVGGARNRLNQIGGRASGGPISGPGTGTSDDVLMWGSDGEWVIREAVASKLGDDQMDLLNSGKGQVVPAYAGGGKVGRAGLPAYAGGGAVGAGGLPAYAGGGAIGGGGAGGLIGQAIGMLRELRAQVSSTWAGVNGDTNAGFTTLAQTIATRMAEIVAVAGGQATETANVVGGQFGRVSLDADTHFGAAALAVGTRMAGAKSAAVTEAGLTQAGVGAAFAGTVVNTDAQFGAVQGSVGLRMAGARATGTAEAALLQTGLAGSWGATALNTDQQFGAVQGTVGARMLASQVSANTEARNLYAGVSGQWGATAVNTDQQFGAMQGTVSNRMLVTRDDANRKSNETNVGVTGAFRSMDGSANTIWSGMMGNAARKFDELKGHVDRPVRWVVDIAWNRGARGLWDAAGRIFPLGPFPAAKYAVGGPVYGPGTGTSDSIVARLSNNEHVWTEKEVQGAGGHGEVARLRAMAKSGSLATFADGGAWRGMFGYVKKQFPSATLNSAYRPGDPGYHGAGQAIDVGGPMMAINQWLARTRGITSAELIYTPGINLKNGRPHTYNAATRADHFDHVHWATGVLNGNAGVGGGAAGTVFSMVDMLMDAITGPRNALRDMVGKAWPKNGTLAGDLPSLSVDWMIGQAEGLLRKKAEEMDALAMSGGGGAGAQQWAGVASLALQMLGQPLSLLPRVLEQIMIESSGNPSIVNTWDSNAARGTPSMGLIQTIMPTYRRFADPRRDLGPLDPLSNLLAGMRYAIATYGGIANIWPKRMGYHDGGAIPGSGFADDKLVMAQSGERVLTRGQNVAFERFVSVLDRPTPMPAAFRGRVMGGDGAATTVEIHNENHFREAVDLDLFNSRQDFQVRSVTF